MNEAIPFTTVTKRIKYIGKNLLKKTENYKKLIKEIKDDTKRLKDR